MEYEIKNGYLKVRIAPKGGELRSVCDKYGQEYLWQGDAATWQGHGPNLFPYVGRLTGEHICTRSKYIIWVFMDF